MKLFTTRWIILEWWFCWDKPDTSCLFQQHICPHPCFPAKCRLHHSSRYSFQVSGSFFRKGGSSKFRGSTASNKKYFRIFPLSNSIKYSTTLCTPTKYAWSEKATIRFLGSTTTLHHRDARLEFIVFSKNRGWLF